MSDLSGFITGFSNALNQYVGTQQQNQMQMKNEVFKNQLSEQSKIKEQAANQQSELEKGKGLEQNKLDLAGKMTPDMAEQTVPGSSKWVQQFQQQNNRLPTIDEAKDGLLSAAAKLNAGDDKEQKRQDMLEKQFGDKLTTVRGDQSLQRVEKQRDAAGMAYDTIAKAQGENRPLSELEYADLVGQLWQARTGAAPTDKVMEELKQKTAKEGINRVITYVSGNPNLIGATTTDTMNNLKQFTQATGQKSDQQWNAYMAPRMNPPTGLDKDRVEHVSSQHRGLSFADQQKVSDTTYKSAGTLQAKKDALRAKLGL
jgi:hypothetical protein